MVRWGICIPNECSSLDLQNSLKDNLGVPTQIRPGMCQKSTKNTISLNVGDYIARIFFGFVIFSILLSSMLDYFAFHSSTENKNGCAKFFECFSLKRNISKLVQVREENNKEIAGLHGIRALNVLSLLMSHKAVALFFNPFMNRTATIDKLTKPWTIVAKNAIVYTDSFLLLSGLLNANALLTDLHKIQTMNFLDKLITRIFRYYRH